MNNNNDCPAFPVILSIILRDLSKPAPPSPKPPMPHNRQFAPRHPAPDPAQIEALRLQAGWSISGMAEALGVAENSVQAWIDGRRRMPEPCWRLAQLLTKEKAP